MYLGTIINPPGRYELVLRLRYGQAQCHGVDFLFDPFVYTLRCR